MSGLERYQISGELGRGAMGVVYRAWDPMLERSVALKELMLPGAVDEDVRADLVARFLREARAAARLQHPNVVQVFDVFSEDDRHFIAMELLEGAPLNELLEHGPLSEGAARDALLQILDAVGAAHAAGIVHRDLKPDNIYILEDGRIKVTDFGIAKVTDATHATRATQIGTIIGTPGYMAPEQVQGLAVDARADLFAIGVVGCELFSGRHPFLANSPTATLYRIVNEPPAMEPVIPGPVAGVLVKAMQKDPALRYASAAEMVHDLRNGVLPVIGVSAQGGVPAAAAAGQWSATPTTVAGAPTGWPATGPAQGAPRSGGANKTLIAVAAVMGVAAVLLLVFMMTNGGPKGGQAVVTANATGTQAVPAAEKEPEPAPAPVAAAPTPPPASSYEPPPAPFWGAFAHANPDRAAAEAFAAEMRAKGFDPYILDTINYSTIGKPGQSIWVITSGAWGSEGDAEGEVARLKGAGYSSAYSKRVAP